MKVYAVTWIDGGRRSNLDIFLSRDALRGVYPSVPDVAFAAAEAMPGHPVPVGHADTMDLRHLVVHE